MKIVQMVRVLDVFWLGGLLIFVALKYKMPSIVKAQLLIAGVCTILFNAYRLWRFSKYYNPNISLPLPGIITYELNKP